MGHQIPQSSAKAQNWLAAPYRIQRAGMKIDDADKDIKVLIVRKSIACCLCLVALCKGTWPQWSNLDCLHVALCLLLQS